MNAKPIKTNPQRKRRSISPTDVSQFIRLGQSERYLHLRLWERAEGRGFMARAGVFRQTIPPLLTKVGGEFETEIARGVAARFSSHNLAVKDRNNRSNNNKAVAEIARTLPRGAISFIFQARIAAPVHGWRMRGDIDVLRLERDAADRLHILIVDLKSSTQAKVEHRLQVAFYQVMIAALLAREQVAYNSLSIGILYRGEASHPEQAATAPDEQQLKQREQAVTLFSASRGLLEIIADQRAYLDAVEDLVTGATSLATRVADAQLDDVPYHLSRICDGCMYNEYCLKLSAEQDDLSLLPYLTMLDKQALHNAEIRTVTALSQLKEYRDPAAHDYELVAAPGYEQLAGRLATTWPIGPRLDELIHRARRYRRWQGEEIAAPANLPSKGHGTLPFSDPEHNPNLIRIYIDAQHDYLEDRLYMLGALIVANEGGVERVGGRVPIVAVASGPPDHAAVERDLIVRWIEQVLAAVVNIVAPDEAGQRHAPIHLIFFDRYGQKTLLDGLSRHMADIFAATHLYDFVTQLPAFDSALVTHLEDEIRELKNYPMLSQSLQEVARYLRFDWRSPEDFRRLFRERMFDARGKLPAHKTPPGRRPWYTKRARFNSQIPLEYAYAGWDKLPAPPPGDERDLFANYRAVTTPLLQRFQQRRLEAIEWIARDFKGNQQTLKSEFSLPDLLPQQRPVNLARAIDEFVIIERHVELSAWRALRNLAPERRVLMGETLLLRYHDADQSEKARADNEEHKARQRRIEQYKAVQEGELTDEQWKEVGFASAGLELALRIETGGTGADLDKLLGLIDLRAGSRVVLYERLTVDGRLPLAARIPFTPTPRQLLYGARATLKEIVAERDAHGALTQAVVKLRLEASFADEAGRLAGFLFSGKHNQIMADDQLYTIDPDPNNIYGYWCHQVAKGLLAIEAGEIAARNTLYERLERPQSSPVRWDAAEIAGQQQFFAGLLALAGPPPHGLHGFDEQQAAYIREHGGEDLLLVQGPPGTGKSYSTAFAVLARMQGAMRANRPFRVLLSCKTHAATDVLIGAVLEVQDKLRALAQQRPQIFVAYFEPRLLDVPLFRLYPRKADDEAPADEEAKEQLPERIQPLQKDSAQPYGQKQAADRLKKQTYAVVAGPPGGIRKLIAEKWTGKDLYGHYLVECLVLDEASQMNLAEAMMAALPLQPDGQLIVVGDQRQMAPIVQHDWAAEPRRTFQQYQSYESLFVTVQRVVVAPQIQFKESFRLHASMAEFLRRAIYQEDNIPLFSRRDDLLPQATHEDKFVAAVLDPRYPIVVVVHDEAQSQTSNEFEQELIGLLLQALSAAPYNLNPKDGLGVVVPHRAQRAGFQVRYPDLLLTPGANGAARSSAVDTVERFQGSEREVIMISATESARDYLLANGEFLFQPSRLTVALSRAKRKLVLVAARSIFSVFSADEQAFQNGLLWKRLLRETCTVPLFDETVYGPRVQVWGNRGADS